MTVPATPRRAGPFYGDGSATQFPFGFKVYARSDVLFTVALPSGDSTPLVLDTDYTVTLNLNQDTSPGGYVTYPISGSPLPNGGVAAITGNLTYTQPTDLPDGGAYRARNVETMGDRIVMLVQQHDDKLDRTLTFPPTDNIIPEFPPLAERANRLLGFDDQGQFVGVLPASGSAAALSLDLANTASASKGAAIPGYSATVAYTSGVGKHLYGEPVDPCDFPFNCPTDGVSDCTTAIQQAHSLGRGVRLRPGTFRCNLSIAEPLNIVGSGNATILRAFNTAQPVLLSRADVSWKFQRLENVYFLAVSQTGTGFCFGHPTTYTAGVELAGRVRFVRCIFDGFDKGVHKPWGNIGNQFDSCTFLQNNYGLWARGAQVGFGGAAMMHCGNDTYLNCEFNDNRKAGRLYMDTTPGWGGVVDSGGVILQFNQGFGSFFDLNLPSFTAYTAIQEHNTWYESNGLAGTVSVDTLTGVQSLAAGNTRLSNDSALLNYTRYERTIGLGADQNLASINVCSSNRPVMDLICDYAGNISRSNVFRAVERVGGAVLATFGFAAQSATETVWQVGNGSGLLRVFKNGSLVVNSTAASGAGVHRIQGTSGIAAGSLMLEVQGAGGAAPSGFFYVADSDNSNVANTVLRVGRNFTTGRSINAGGTVGTSGADYAEYENNGGLSIDKGAIVGFKSDGTLSLKFSESFRFGIKSTNPSFVGGDTYGSEENVGPPPVAPAQFSTEMPQFNGEPPAFPGSRATEEQLKVYRDRLAAYEEWQDAVRAYDVERAEFLAQYEIDYATYQTTLAAFNDRVEAARRLVDRIAYSGKVPVNVRGAAPGDYIVATGGAGDSIVGVPVSVPSFDQYRKAVGRVNRILDDGRAEVAVIVH